MQRMISTVILISSVLFSSLVMGASVNRAQFTSDIIDREPVDKIATLGTEQRQIIFFTELADLQGQTVTHQWIYNDSIMFEKSFEVGGPRWRVWTSKTLQPAWNGTWVVNILDGERNILSTESFEYQ